MTACALVVAGITGSSSAAPTSGSAPPDLNSVKWELDRTAPKISGTGWVVDEATNSVLVTYDDTVPSDKVAILKNAIAKHGSAVRLQRVPGETKFTMAGGDLIASPNPDGTNRNCSLGFNAINESTGVYYAITAGHCTLGRENWYTNNALSVYLGNEVSSRLGGPNGVDMGLIQYRNAGLEKYGGIHRHDNGQYYNITGSGGVSAGDYICKSGIKTHTTCGNVTSPCGTITIQGVTLYCMIYSTMCVEGGDSGGPVWRSSLGVGIVSGGVLYNDPDLPNYGKCVPPEEGGRSYSYPLREIESYYGIKVF